MHNAVLILLFSLFVLLSGLFSGSETGLYRLSRLRLRLGVEKKRLPFIMLGRCMHESSELLLSMLVGTNLFNYLATGIIAAMLLSKGASENTAEIVTTAITAPVLFVFSELIPKNIFFYRSDTLMPYVAPLLYTLQKLLSMTGITGLLKFISAFFSRLAGSATSSKTVITSVQRHAVQAILQDTREEGVLSAIQSDIVNRLVKTSNVSVRFVMIPIDHVRTVDVNCGESALLDVLRESAFTRLPVTEAQPTNITGFINIYDVLSDSQKFDDLRSFVKPLKKLDSNTPVIDAINFMQRENQKIILVTKAGLAGRQKPVGIVTMKDLVEELLGELAEW